LHSIADDRHFGHLAFAVCGAGLRSFAAKNSQTVENDRELCATDTAIVFLKDALFPTLLDASECVFMRDLAASVTSGCIELC
jgi:hypothetical protein